MIKVLHEDNTEILFSTERYCNSCKIGFSEPDPRWFSYNSRHGWCPQCEGYGFHREVDPELLILDESLSINEGALAPLEDNTLPKIQRQQLLKTMSVSGKIPLDRPIKDFTEKQRNILLQGNSSFIGLMEFIRRRSEAASPDEELESGNPFEHYLIQVPCTACGGTRLSPLGFIS